MKMTKSMLHPTVCNLCGGKVIFTSNSVIYHRPYGSGKCYLCTNCGAYVGTHKPRPKEAMGLLADVEMRALKMQCHDIFDLRWQTRKERNQEYQKFAAEMGISVSECHFGWFNKEELRKALSILNQTNVKI